MRITLRLRVLFLVAAVNAATFGAGLYFLTDAVATNQKAAQSESSQLLGYFVSTISLSPTGELRVPQLLRWPHWQRATDAILVSNLIEEPDGLMRARGVFLNPVGRAERPFDFDTQGVLRRAARAIETGEDVEGPLGTSVPIRDEAGDVWGASWFMLSPRITAWDVLIQLLPWFLLSTLLMTLGTFYVLRRFVLDPVRVLAGGSQRVRSGDFGVRLPEPAYHDELSDLMHGFNEMTGQIQVFHERLEEEAQIAREQARSAEAAAIRQKQLAAMGELAAGIAHEINNPLGGLLNAVDALQRGTIAEERRRRYFELLQDGLLRIQGTVAKLLRFTPRDAEFQSMQLADAVQDAVSLARHRAEQQGGKIIVEILGDSRVRGLRGELGQAVLNLLFNALDAIAERAGGGGRVDVCILRRAEEVVLVVKDDGPGVEAADLERVADLFYTTKDVGKGTGLGLALVIDVVRRHDGRVQFSSAPGEGFSVEVVLPHRENS